jgi:hypothetical protein
MPATNPATDKITKFDKALSALSGTVIIVWLGFVSLPFPKWLNDE